MRKISCAQFLVVATVIIFGAAASAHAQWSGGQSRWRDILSNPPDFYGSPESIRAADHVLLYQNDNGGWPKNIEMARKLTDSQKKTLEKDRNKSETLIDNGATWYQIRYLALMHEATGDQRFADAALRGINFLLAAQYPNGGWPMIVPLRKGYYSRASKD